MPNMLETTAPSANGEAKPPNGVAFAPEPEPAASTAPDAEPSPPAPSPAAASSGPPEGFAAWLPVAVWDPRLTSGPLVGLAGCVHTFGHDIYVMLRLLPGSTAIGRLSDGSLAEVTGDVLVRADIDMLPLVSALEREPTMAREVCLEAHEQDGRTRYRVSYAVAEDDDGTKVPKTIPRERVRGWG